MNHEETIFGASDHYIRTIDNNLQIILVQIGLRLYKWFFFYKPDTISRIWRQEFITILHPRMVAYRNTQAHW